MIFRWKKGKKTEKPQAVEKEYAVETVQGVPESQSIEEEEAPKLTEAMPEFIEKEVEHELETTKSFAEEPIVSSDMDSKAPLNEPSKEKRAGLFARLKQGLSKTRKVFSEGVANAVLGRKVIDDELFEELEEALLVADVGVDTSRILMDELTKAVSRKELDDGDALLSALKTNMTKLLAEVEAPIKFDSAKTPYVILMVGVNGSGKTTTIGKLAKRLQSEGKRVMLAAGDTFRAAAIEQLQVWGQRNQIPVVSQQSGADSAAVIFDALQSAKAKGVDVLIADTAGRLHTQDHLMEELKKVHRVIKKLDQSAPHEVLLVLDAGIGQNALSQARAFQKAVDVTGITVTKLDGTAKGGILLAIANQLCIPIRFIGVGETLDDLRPFCAKDFVEALFAHDSIQ